MTARDLWAKRARLWPWAASFALLVAGAALLLARPGAEAVAAAGAPRSSAAAGTSPAERARIEAIVRDYILANPEIIPEAITALQNREVVKLVADNRAEIETPYGSAWAGAKNGDVTLVEFYDYACPYCAQARRDVVRLLAEDDKLRVVYRDFPVLSDSSREAATASLSAARQGRHAAFYAAMFAEPGRVTHEKVVANVRRAGLNEVRTARDLSTNAHKAEIDRNLELGRALGLSGTPAYVVGDQVLSGAVGYEALKQAVAAARARPATVNPTVTGF